MKKLLAFLVCAVVIIGQLLLPVTGRQAIMPGDLNKSRAIEATDALICLQGAVGKYELVGDMESAADVNADNKISATDALLILQYAVGKIAIFPSAEKELKIWSIHWTASGTFMPIKPEHQKGRYILRG